MQTFENTAFSENLEIGKSGNFDVESVKKDYLLKLPFLTKNYVFLQKFRICSKCEKSNFAVKNMNE